MEVEKVKKHIPEAFESEEYSKFAKLIIDKHPHKINAIVKMVKTELSNCVDRVIEKIRY